MSPDENYDILVIGSGEAGKYLAWTTAGEGHRAAVVERKYIGGSCPNIACLPSKNIIHSAKVRSFTMRAAEFGVELESAVTSMKGVQARKRAMVDGLRQLHLDRYRASGAELIMGEARFTGDRTVDVELNDGGSRRIRGERVFLDLGTHATVPEIPGLAAARVGCNESEARRRGIGYRLLTMPMAAVLRTRTISEPRGFMKMLVAADSDQILGFTAFGAEASELMAAVQTAMVGRLPYTTLHSAIYAHPTMAEGLTFLLRNTPTPAGN